MIIIKNRVPNGFTNRSLPHFSESQSKIPPAKALIKINNITIILIILGVCEEQFLFWN